LQLIGKISVSVFRKPSFPMSFNLLTAQDGSAPNFFHGLGKNTYLL